MVKFYTILFCFLFSSQLFAQQIIKNPEQIKLENPGNYLNKSGDEQFPALGTDGNTLYFTSKRDKALTDDIWKANLSSSHFKAATIKVSQVAPNPNNEISAVVQKNTRYFASDVKKSSKGNFDLYTRNSSNTTTNLIRLNSEHWEGTPSLSKDGSKIFFSSTRPGGRGGKDIWYARWNFIGKKWNTPQVIAAISSSSDELAPCILDDGNTLVFASNNDVDSKGGYDLFVTKYDTKKNKWSLPINLGAPINSSSDEIGFTIANSGLVFFASNRTDVKNHQGGFDIIAAHAPNLLTDINSFIYQTEVIVKPAPKTVEVEEKEIDPWGEEEEEEEDDGKSFWDNFKNTDEQNKAEKEREARDKKKRELIEGSTDRSDFQKFAVVDTTGGKKVPNSKRSKYKGPVVIIKGHLKDMTTNLPLGTKIYFVNFYGRKTMCRSNSKDGRFQTVLPSGGKYEVVVNKHMVKQNAEFELDQSGTFKEVKKEIVVQSFQIGMKLFDLVAFNRNDSIFNADLTELATILKKNRHITVEFKMTTYDSYPAPYKKKVEYMKKKRKRTKKVTVTTDEQIKMLAAARMKSLKEAIEKAELRENQVTIISDVRFEEMPQPKKKRSRKKRSKKEVKIEIKTPPQNVFITVKAIDSM